MSAIDNGVGQFSLTIQNMTLRDYFAAMALQGFMVGYANHEMLYPDAVKLAFQVADSMIAERDGKEPA